MIEHLESRWLLSQSVATNAAIFYPNQRRPFDLVGLHRAGEITIGVEVYGAGGPKHPILSDNAPVQITITPTFKTAAPVVVNGWLSRGVAVFPVLLTTAFDTYTVKADIQDTQPLSAFDRFDLGPAAMASMKIDSFGPDGTSTNERFRIQFLDSYGNPGILYSNVTIRLGRVEPRGARVKIITNTKDGRAHGNGDAAINVIVATSKPGDVSVDFFSNLHVPPIWSQVWKSLDSAPI